VLRELPGDFFGGLSNPSGAISRKLALPAPDTPQNQIESKPAPEVLEVESESSEVSE
jgi:hypothetical protein